MNILSTVKEPVVVGGVTPLTTIDYPGELAAVIFLQGCPWRCGYCQNKELLPRNSANNPVAWQEIIGLLDRRKGLLDAVVFSGGEPTVQAGLPTAIDQVKSMGYKVGLHTAGIYPERLERLLPLVDWVGMDIKSSKSDYQNITGVKGSGERAWKSAELLIASNVAYEFRTTVHPDMLSKEQISTLIHELADIGARHYVIQQCVTRHCLDKSRRIPTSESLAVEQLNELGFLIHDFSIRSVQ
jgi:pyruvate formate lyase activating enzyme